MFRNIEKQVGEIGIRWSAQNSELVVLPLAGQQAK